MSGSTLSASAFLDLIYIRKQEVFASSLFAAFFDGEAKRIADGQPKLPEDKSFAPFSVSYFHSSSRDS